MSDFSGTNPDPFDLAVRAVLNCVMRGKGRKQIASELSARLGRKVTVRMLDGFTCEGKQGSRFPAAWVTALCEITGDNSLLQLMVGPELDAALTLVRHARKVVAKDIARSNERSKC